MLSLLICMSTLFCTCSRNIRSGTESYMYTEQEMIKKIWTKSSKQHAEDRTCYSELSCFVLLAFISCQEGKWRMMPSLDKFQDGQREEKP